MTHTSGPWEMLKEARRAIASLPDDALGVEVRTEDDYWFIKDELLDNIDATIAKAEEAPDPVYAAARDLLAACKAVVNDSVDADGCHWCDRDITIWPHEDWCPIPQTEAAIAKAEGKRQ